MVVVERGVVSFVEKARHAQEAGATCVVIINSEDNDYMPLGMQSDPGDDIHIPVVCMRRSHEALILLSAPQPSTATLRFRMASAAAEPNLMTAENGEHGTIGSGEQPLPELATPVRHTRTGVPTTGDEVAAEPSMSAEQPHDDGDHEPRLRQRGIKQACVHTTTYFLLQQSCADR